MKRNSLFSVIGVGLIAGFLLVSFLETFAGTQNDGKFSYSDTTSPAASSSEEVYREGTPGALLDASDKIITVNKYDFEKVKVISLGRLIDLIKYIEPGRYTAFLFYADWCGPCKTLKPRLEQFAESVDTFALREIDIINWENPLVTYYKLPSIPYFIIYGPDGNFIERGPAITNETMKELSGGE